MLSILVGSAESYDEAKQEFVHDGGVWLELEHSLLSLSKWEEEWEKPFLGKDAKSSEEIVSYIRMMTLTPNPPAGVFQQLSRENFETINAYLEKKHTATWFSDAGQPPRTSEVITSELVYYWMTAFNIPFEAERWNLSRLFTLIRVCNAKSSKPKKMSRTEVAARNRELNEQRRKQLGTTG